MARRDFEDDGRTIADMSGIERPSLFAFRRPGTSKAPSSFEQERPQKARSEEKLDRKQSRTYIAGALLAGLLIAAVFIICGAIAIALMTLFWKH